MQAIPISTVRADPPGRRPTQALAPSGAPSPAPTGQHRIHEILHAPGAVDEQRGLIEALFAHDSAT